MPDRETVIAFCVKCLESGCDPERVLNHCYANGEYAGINRGREIVQEIAGRMSVPATGVGHEAPMPTDGLGGEPPPSGV